jgi:hypothetical protein
MRRQYLLLPDSQEAVGIISLSGGYKWRMPSHGLDAANLAGITLSFKPKVSLYRFLSRLNPSFGMEDEGSRRSFDFLSRAKEKNFLEKI